MLGEIITTRPPKRDVYQRSRLFDVASFTHHAKANLNLLQAILDRYTDPGDWVVDPMAGTGSIYVAMLTGRRVLAGDIEAQWARLLRDNQMRICGRSLIAFSSEGLACRWDAARLPLAAGQADLVCTSPPYFDTFSDWDAKSQHMVEDDRLNEHGISYGVHPGQIANIHIYEEYLSAMLAIYVEAKRVSGPGGKLVLIVKDVIRGGQRLPVVEDNLSLARSAGFSLLERYDIPTRGTQFRNVQMAKLGQAGPQTETVLVLEKREIQPKWRLALLELPHNQDGPGWIIAQKASTHAISGGFEVWTRSPDEKEFRYLVGAAPQPNTNSSAGRTRMKARRRRALAFWMVRQLQVKADIGSGSTIAFYGSERFGKYICRRLETLGCSVVQPLKGKNNGQRLRWLTQQGR